MRNFIRLWHDPLQIADILSGFQVNPAVLLAQRENPPRYSVVNLNFLAKINEISRFFWIFLYFRLLCLVKVLVLLGIRRQMRVIVVETLRN